MFNESLLHWMEVIPIRQAFYGGNRSPGRRRHRRNARVLRLAIEQDRAGSAISIAAAIFGPSQTQVIAQDGQKRCLSVHVHLVRFSIYQ